MERYRQRKWSVAGNEGVRQTVRVELLQIVCPRCGSHCEVEYYGPCRSCREQLKSTLGGDARAVTAAEYEPKRNVTPNAVALKDD